MIKTNFEIASEIHQAHPTQANVRGTRILTSVSSASAHVHPELHGPSWIPFIYVPGIHQQSHRLKIWKVMRLPFYPRFMTSGLFMDSADEEGHELPQAPSIKPWLVLCDLQPHHVVEGFHLGERDSYTRVKTTIMPSNISKLTSVYKLSAVKSLLSSIR